MKNLFEGQTVKIINPFGLMFTGGEDVVVIDQIAPERSRNGNHKYMSWESGVTVLTSDGQIVWLRQEDVVPMEVN